jgi:hypothetical protein
VESDWVVMKRFVFLVICIAVGASLSGCASSREAFFNDVWIGGPTQGAGGGDTARPAPDDVWDGGGWPEEGTDSRGWLPDR